MTHGLRTLADALRNAEGRMAEAGVPSPGFDARALAAHLLRLPVCQLALHYQCHLTEEEAGEFGRLVARRCAREPLQYITGETEFFGRVFRCDPRALIPRPDTEVLVEVALDLVRELIVTSVVDVGSGNGVIALTLAAEAPHLTVLATDASPSAVALTAENLAMHNLSDRVTLAQGNCLEPLRALSWWERAQMVVSNPPYVRAEDYDDLAPEITQHEPREALIASDRDGLRFYRQLLPECAQLPALRAAAFEVGAGSAPAVAQLVMDALPEFEVAVRKDYGGIERVVSGRRMRGVD